MASTATAFIENIDTTFPVPGVDNDTQGFRDNYITIKSGLTALANEVTDLMTNPLAEVTSLNTLTQLDISGIATISQLIVNGLDITPSANGTFELNTLTATTIVTENITATTITLTASGTERDPAVISFPESGVLFSGVSSLTINDTTATISKSLSSWSGNQNNLYLSTLTLDSVVGIGVGYTFKVWSTESSVHSVLSVNTVTNEITTVPFDPSTVPDDVIAGDPIEFTKSNFVGLYGGVAPVNQQGAPGDKKGSFFGDGNFLYVCTKDHVGDSSNIWEFYPNATGFCKYVSAPPLTVKGSAGDKKGNIYATSTKLWVCIADYTNGSPDIWFTQDVTGYARYAGSQPTSSKGSAGDKKGDIFATASYIYVCMDDYTTGVADIWSRSSASGTWS